MADTREPEDRPRPASPLLSSPTSPYVTSPPVSLRSSPACPRSSPDSSPHFSPDAPRLGSRPSRRLVSSPQISSGLVVVSSGLVRSCLVRSRLVGSRLGDKRATNERRTWWCTYCISCFARTRIRIRIRTRTRIWIWRSTVLQSAGARRCRFRPRRDAGIDAARVRQRRTHARTHRNVTQRNVTHGRALVVINTFAERPPSVRLPVDMNIRPPMAPYVRSLTRARVCVRARFGVSCAVRLEWAGGGW